MKHSVPHDLGKDGAKRAALAAFTYYGERYAKYNPTATWKTEDSADVSFTAKGMTLKGALAIKEASIDMDLDIPFLLRPFKDRALGYVDREVGNWIGKARAGEI